MLCIIAFANSNRHSFTRRITMMVIHPYQSEFGNYTIYKQMIERKISTSNLRFVQDSFPRSVLLLK